MLSSQKYGKNLLVNYSPFGAILYGRNWSSEKYRYGFQGQERDDEMKGEGNSVNFTYRMHDPRLGRFLSIDPLHESFPWNSPYTFSENSTISCIDIEGLERYYAADGEYLGKYGRSNQIRVVNTNEVGGVKEYFSGKIKSSEVEAMMFYWMPSLGSVKYSAASASAQIAVTTSIYKSSVQGKYPLKSIKVEPKYTARVEDVGKFLINPYKTYEDEELYDDYYNQVNILFHKEKHNENLAIGGAGLGDHYSHIKIAIKQLNHESYAKSTSAFKSYVKKIYWGYLDGAESYLSNELFNSNNPEETYNSISFQYFLKEYQEGLDYFNKYFDEKREKLDLHKIHIEDRDGDKQEK